MALVMQDGWGIVFQKYPSERLKMIETAITFLFFLN